MLFSIIYTADTTKGESIKKYYPPKFTRGTWQRTETGPSEYDYLEGSWRGGRHGKWCGILTRDQFDTFVARFSLYAEDCETMGSLGAPGFDYGWAPAISFNCVNRDAILNAYVTPMPEVSHPERLTERHWEMTRRAVIDMYK